MIFFYLHLCLKKRLYLENYTKLAENCFKNGNYGKFWFRKVYFKGFLNNWIFFTLFLYNSSLRTISRISQFVLEKSLQKMMKSLTQKGSFNNYVTRRYWSCLQPPPSCPLGYQSVCGVR